MKQYSLVFSLFIILLSNNLFADQGYSTGKVEQLRWYEGHKGLLVVQENMADYGQCGRADYYILDDQHDYFKEIYSLILTSHISYWPLTFEVEGCFQGISRIKHITSNK